jgi:Sec-independent protein secretion pathway component TatC
MRSAWIEVRRRGPQILALGLLSWIVVWGFYREETRTWLVRPMVEIWWRTNPPSQPDLGLEPPPSFFLVNVCLATTFAFLTTLPMLIELLWAIVLPTSLAAIQRSLWQFRLISYVVLALAVCYLRSSLVPQVFARWVVASVTVPINVSTTILVEDYVEFAASRLAVYSLAALFGIVSAFVSRARRAEGRSKSGAPLPLGVLWLAFMSVSAVILPMEPELQARWILPMVALYVLCLMATLLPRRPKISR